MREIPKRPKQHSTSALENRPAGALPRPEPDSPSGREKLEDTLGGALTRVLSRAGLAVRVVPGANAPAGDSEAVRPPVAAPADAPVPECYSADDAGAAAGRLPAGEALITLVTIVLAGRVLGRLPAGALVETAAASERTAAEPAGRGAGSQPVPPAAPPAATPWLAPPSPAVTGPAPAKPAPARVSPAAAAPAPAASKPTAAPAKGRGFTIRY